MDAARFRFTVTDLENLAAIALGGPMDQHRWNVSAVEDFFAACPEFTTAEAVVELLLLIRSFRTCAESEE